MPYDINSQQIDIENLFKQNANDLSSIKELYRKLKDLEEKITQIKYIDSKLADNLKKEYENLKKVILDENIQVKLSNDINKISEQLDTKVTQITPDMFGCKGDGITDDTIALQQMFNCKDNTTIIFPKNKTYLINRGLVLNACGVTIYGNMSKIKYKDNSDVLQLIYSTELTNDYGSIIFSKNADGLSIYDLIFDGNADNVYFIHNNEKYYGYQQDLNIEGIPRKYITTSGISIGNSNNITIKNCEFNHIGEGISFNGGGTWENPVIKRNVTVEDCSITDVFRDGFVFASIKGIKVFNCSVKQGQRKGLQLYKDCHDVDINTFNVSIDVDTLRKWYPTWNTSQQDAELGGIAITNGAYSAYCTNVTIKNITLQTVKFGISLRNCNKDVVIDNGTINSDVGITLFHGSNNLKISGINFTKGLALQYNYKKPSVTLNNVNSYSTEIIENCTFGDRGLYLYSENDCPVSTIDLIIRDNIYKISGNTYNISSTNKENLFNIYSKEFIDVSRTPVKYFNNVYIGSNTALDLDIETLTGTNGITITNGSCYKNSFGEVSLDGVLTGTFSGDAFCYIPVEYRPKIDRWFNVLGKKTDNTYINVPVSVYPSGGLYIEGNRDSLSKVWLDGISFKII